jgi:GNAT superfamily N-acetyltransferase
MTTTSRKLVFRPLAPRLMDCMGAVLRGSWGAGCWCMYPRLTRAEMATMRGAQRREAMTKLARRRRAPGLLAFEGNEPVGWIAVAPRAELARLDVSRATPRVDDVDVWVIPCISVRPSARGRGIAVALIRAAVAYAARWRAPVVEAYPRAGSARTADDNAYFGTEPLFRRAGFRVIRLPQRKAGGKSLRRVTMRVRC